MNVTAASCGFCTVAAGGSPQLFQGGWHSCPSVDPLWALVAWGPLEKKEVYTVISNGFSRGRNSIDAVLEFEIRKPQINKKVLQQCCSKKQHDTM